MSAETIVFKVHFSCKKDTLPFYYFTTTGTKQCVILETEKDQTCLCPERPKPAAEQKKEITKTLIISIIIREKKKDL